jgi:hypothetical protein
MFKFKRYKATNLLIKYPKLIYLVLTLIPIALYSPKSIISDNNIRSYDDKYSLEEASKLLSGELNLGQYLFSRENGHVAIPLKLIFLGIFHLPDKYHYFIKYSIITISIVSLSLLIFFTLNQLSNLNMRDKILITLIFQSSWTLLDTTGVIGYAFLHIHGAIFLTLIVNRITLNRNWIEVACIICMGITGLVSIPSFFAYCIFAFSIEKRESENYSKRTRKRLPKKLFRLSAIYCFTTGLIQGGSVLWSTASSKEENLYLGLSVKKNLIALFSKRNSTSIYNEYEANVYNIPNNIGRNIYGWFIPRKILFSLETFSVWTHLLFYIVSILGIVILGRSLKLSNKKLFDLYKVFIFSTLIYAALTYLLRGLAFPFENWRYQPLLPLFSIIFFAYIFEKLLQIHHLNKLNKVFPGGLLIVFLLLNIVQLVWFSPYLNWFPIGS